MKVKSFAKINLGLEILGKREDGFHQVRTLLQSINLFDILNFRSLEDGAVEVSGDDDSVPWDESNLIFKAAVLFKKRYDVRKGVEIKVQKRIPPGKGLGGGSSNAAMTLYALNKMWNMALSRKEMLSLSRRLGADVFYFLEGGLCLGEERGELITPLNDLDSHACVLIFPPLQLSTARVYQQGTMSLTSEGKDSKINKFLKNGELGSLENQLEKTVFDLYPQLKDIKEALLREGADLSLVSGSGSAIFGIYSDKEKAKAAGKEWRGKGRLTLVMTLNRKNYWEDIRVGV
ncbi:4-(cytidine 5'-diphospho)-2-C-methyl-D-erythritol kinase [bacterium]|nr:4-(cytidine 5'-diphospho)-2-C-methyl-D-erythritol kinase [bacterium]